MSTARASSPWTSYDARSRQPLWHASADQSLSDVSGEEAAKRIDAAVAAIFAKGSSG